MKVYVALILLMAPLFLVAQIEIESQEIMSESSKGIITQHEDAALFNVYTKAIDGINSFLVLRPGTAIQGAAVSIGTGVVGLSSAGYGLRGVSGNDYGLHSVSNLSHGGYFRGNKEDGFADIVLGAFEDSVNGTIMSDPDAEGSNLFVAANNHVIARVDKNNNGAGAFIVHGTFSDAIFQIDINGNVNVNGTTVHGSDRNRKEHISEVSNTDILNAIIEMPIYEWQYKKEDRRHIGPMAQDFHKAFGLGEDDKSIAAIDADGVALAAIKAQQMLIEEQARQLKLQGEQIALLIKKIDALADSR